MTVNRKKLRNVLAVIGLGIVYYIILSLTSFRLECPIYKGSHGHIKCPGCGISRACVRLIRLDIRGAFYYHPIAVSMAPLWIVCGAMWLFDRGGRFNKAVEWITLIVLLAYMILRNIPGFPLY